MTRSLTTWLTLHSLLRCIPDCPNIGCITAQFVEEEEEEEEKSEEEGTIQPSGWFAGSNFLKHCILM